MPIFLRSAEAKLVCCQNDGLLDDLNVRKCYCQCRSALTND